MRKLLLFLPLSLLILLTAGCETDFTNPGAASDGQVLASVDGLIAVAVGAQRRYTIGRQSPVYTRPTAAGFTTGELRLINPGNESENNLDLGGDLLDGDNAIVNNLWSQSLLVRNDANSVLENLDLVSDAGLAAGLRAYATVFYALANETLFLFFEQAPVETAIDAAFQDRSALLESSVQFLTQAQSALSSNTVPASFLSQIPNGIDLENTVAALLARHQLFLGNYPAAISAAESVDRSATSVFQFDGVTQNPIAFVSITTDNVYQPLNLTLGLPDDLTPDSDDGRLAFYFEDLAPPGDNFRAAGFYDANDKSIPVYLPGEMDLIIAEAEARQNNLDAAVAALDNVLTKSADDDIYGIGAGLDAYDGPETQEDILEAIYLNRAVEFQLSGFRLEDSRRFGRSGPNAASPERNRNFYPYPNSERDNNPNTPPNPAI